MKRLPERKNFAYKLPPQFSILLFFVLLTGIALTLMQVHRQQTTHSSASIATPTPILLTQNCAVNSDQLQMSPEEQRLFDQINSHRQEQGLSPLILSPILKQATAWMSNDMLINSTLSHIDSLNRDEESRLADCGYPLPAIFGENIDSGTTDANLIYSSWINSPSHNMNLLNTQFTQAGISLASGSAGQAYWTLDLAGPAPQLTVTPSPSTASNLTPATILTPSPTYRLPPTGTPLPTYRVIPTAIPLPTVIPSPTLPPFIANPFDTQVYVSIKIPGIGMGGNRNPRHLSRHIVISLFDLTNQPVVNGYGYLTYDRNDLFRGIIHLGKVPNDTYIIKMLSDHMLASLVLPEFQKLNNAKLNMLPQVTLAAGDINDDNVLDLNDYNLALSCFQDKNCQTKDLIDFNDDGRTDIIDYNVLLQNYWRQSGD